MPGADVLSGAGLLSGADLVNGADLPSGADLPNGAERPAAAFGMIPRSFGPVLFPPVGYSPGWIALAVGILVLIIAFFVIVPLLTRSRERAETVDAAWIPDFLPVDLRLKYLDLVEEVEASHRRGELSVRGAHQRLSLLLRFFAYEQSGLGAPQMTLADLRSVRSGDVGARQLVGAVERLYPGAFAAVERGSVSDAAETARRVVQSWN